MDAHEIVVHHVERDSGSVVLNLLAERFGPPGESAHPHPHSQIGALDIAGADILGVGVADNRRTFTPDALRRAIALLGIGGASVDLDQLGIVHVAPKSSLNGTQIGS